MASSPISKIGFLDEARQPIDAPREWMEGHVSVDCGDRDWRGAQLTCNGTAIPLSVSRIDGEDVVLGRWTRSGAGNYELLLCWDDELWEESRVCTVEPRNLDFGAVATMVEHLDRRLPASIALTLRRGGALGGIDIVAPGETTLAAEVNRLSRAIDGTKARAGLAKVLLVVSEQPHRVLHAEERWVAPHQARRIDPVRFALASGRGSSLSADGLPAVVPERPVKLSVDVYENRLLRTFHEQVDVRLRTVVQALKNRGDHRVTKEALTLSARLRDARRQASFLDQVAPLSEPPSRVSMLLLRQPEYRAAMEGFIEFRRSAIVHLREPAIDAPLENLPFLYQCWGLLEVLSVVLDAAVDHGYQVVTERLAVRAAGEFWIRLLSDGEPVAELSHPESGGRVRIVPQRRYKVRQGDLRSISFEQIPDISIEFIRDEEIAVYIFDPKYKLRGDDGAGPGSRPKKEDVDAMHAYRDAIRAADGERVVRHAALLYPGSSRHFGNGLAALQAQPHAYEQLRQEVRSVLGPALAP
jgi:PD-(D/E)XK nuclease superfamily/Domain of unknown function (DUF2357)